MYRAGKHYLSVSDGYRAVSEGCRAVLQGRRAGVAAVLPAVRRVLLVASGAGVFLVAGCGNMYRPVVSAISPVGPAGQPTKYAIAVSNPNVAQTTVTGFTIAGNVITVTVVSNPFTAGQSVSLTGFTTSTFLNGQTVTVLSTGLSATQFQANLTHANATSTEVGNAIFLGSQLGLLTFVDVSGDTVLSTPQIQSNPSYFVLTTGGGTGYTINAEGQFDLFPTGNPTSLITSGIGQTTLSVNSGAVSLSAFTPASTSTTVFVPGVASSTISALNGGTGALYDTIATGLNPMGLNPIYVVGTDGTPRVYALSQGQTPGVSQGSATAIETVTTASLAVSSTIPLGINPIYGVMGGDDRRAYILNKGPSTLPSPCTATTCTGTVSVINVVNNALDSPTPTITIPAIAIPGGFTQPNPIWAGLSPLTSELIVLNQGDGVNPGTLNIISIPLCNSSTIVTNPNCNASNPADAAGFGTVIATATVGVNPVMVSVMQDGSMAWVANAGNASKAGSVTAVSIASGAVLATITGIASPAAPTAATSGYVYGHPNSISATTGAPTGKVYVTSSDSEYLTVIYTDTDTVQNHITLQGSGVRVLVTSP